MFLLSGFFVLFGFLLVFNFRKKYGKFNFDIAVEKFGFLRLFFLHLIFSFAFVVFSFNLVNYLGLKQCFPGWRHKTIVYFCFFPVVFNLFCFRDELSIFFIKKLFKKFGVVFGCVLLLILFASIVLFLFLVSLICKLYV